MLGGVIVAYSSWRGVFWVNAPMGVGLLAVALRVIPPDPPKRPDGASSLDGIGIALLGVGLASGMAGMTFLGDAPPGWVAWSAGRLAVSATGIVGFLSHVERAQEPLIAPALIHGRGFAAVNLVNICYGGAGIGICQVK